MARLQNMSPRFRLRLNPLTGPGTALSALSIAVSVCLAPPVSAGQALEEVIVTARKREENLQALPQAINALQSDQLEAAQVNNIQNLENIIPNVTIGNGASVGAAGTLNAVVRGIGNEAGFAPGVGIYIDDVYLASANGAILDVYDVERMEVLKGPQGNLYGRNTIGGAIRYITKDPSDTLKAFVQEKIGSFNLRDTTGSVSGPLVDNLLYGGAAVTRKQQDGFQTNDGDGRKYGSVDSWGARGSLKFTPTDTVTAKWVSDYFMDRGLPKQGKRIFSSADYIASINAQGIVDPTVNWSPGKDEISLKVANPGRAYVKTLTHALTLNWEISDEWAAKSVSAYRYSGYAPIQDLDSSVTPGLETTQTVLDAARTQEFQGNYTGDGVDGVIGFYYFKENQRNPLQSLFYPAVAGVNLVRDGNTVSENISKAIYTSWDFDLATDWHLTLGGRYNWDQSTATYTQTETLPDFGNLVLDDTSTDFDKGWRKFTKTIRLAYDISPDTMAYAGYSEGYKQGGFNTQGGNLAFDLGKSTYNPENVKTYALGLKTTLLQNTLRINTEWFYNDYRDKLIRVIASNPVDTTKLLQINENAGSVHTTGIDVDASWSTPLSGLVINGAVGYLQTVIDKYNASQWDPTGTFLLSPDSASNFRMGYAPRWTANLGPVFTKEVESVGTVQLAGNVNYREKSYAVSPTDMTAAYSSSVVSPAHTMYNATVSLTTLDNHWRFAVEGRNLSNVRILSDAFDFGSNLFSSGAYTDPRTWSASVRYQYE
ncbi:MAG TPA: TonB-dependent receptor [Spongiibacteraceae bacterium]|nr:TonB-dependent receptor [Spongiibacteraceae bacterium]